MSNGTRQGAIAVVPESNAAQASMELLKICNVCRSGNLQTVDMQYNFCSCNSCGYIFDNPRPSLAYVTDFYSQRGKYDSWLDEKAEREMLWRRRLKKLLPHKAEGNLLDIGAGIGQFLHHAQPFFTGITGTEISESAVKIAKEKYGIELMEGQIEELALPPASFNNITLFHVLEHVPDPLRMMIRCRELLCLHGVVVIAVPNDVLAWTSSIKKLGSRMGLRAFQKFSPALGIPRAGESREIHLSHFTPGVLARLVENAGFTIVKKSLDPYYVSSGTRLLLDSACYSLHRLMYVALKVNYYDTIWMIARRS